MLSVDTCEYPGFVPDDLLALHEGHDLTWAENTREYFNAFVEHGKLYRQDSPCHYDNPDASDLTITCEDCDVVLYQEARRDTNA